MNINKELIIEILKEKDYIIKSNTNESFIIKSKLGIEKIYKWEGILTLYSIFYEDSSSEEDSIAYIIAVIDSHLNFKDELKSAKNN